MVSLGYQGSVAFIPVGLAALIFYSFPLLVGIIAAISGRDRLTTTKTAALIVAFLGLGLCLGPDFATIDWRGIACASAAALAMSVTIAFGGEAMRGEDVLTMNFYTNLWMLIGLGGFVLVAGGFELPASRLGALGAAGVCIAYVFGYVAWFAASRLVPPVRLAAIFNIEPLATLIIAWLVLGEHLALLQIVGAALVLGSIIVVTRPGAPPRAAA
jgi:drug/metabolite transporter (DMT)-like permease